ncbi:MAG: HAD family hydrolase [Pseudomonadota bacterium]
MKALFFGSTGTLVESSRLERLAYNAAFDELGLDLYWNVATYCKLLEMPGGPRHLNTVFGDDWLAGSTNEVYELQQSHFERLACQKLVLRPGIADSLAFCAHEGIKLGLVTTAPSNFIDTLFRHTEGLDRDAFDLICTGDDVAGGRPGRTVYDLALDALRLKPETVVAIEDSPVNQAAALAADLQCYLFPGEYAHVDHDILVTRDITTTVARVHELWETHAGEKEAAA